MLNHRLSRVAVCEPEPEPEPARPFKVLLKGHIVPTTGVPEQISQPTKMLVKTIFKVEYKITPIMLLRYF